MRIQAALLCAIVSLTSACSLFKPGAAEDGSIQSTVIGTDQAVEAFLAGRELDPIEGAWKHDGSSFDLVISRNNFDIASDYDYVGVITRTSQSSWDHGDVKLLLRRTGAAGTFEGLWINTNRSRKKMTFVIENPNLVQASFKATDGNSYFVRIRRINSHLAARN